jgi:YVTN family beta-propeller protein
MYRHNRNGRSAASARGFVARFAVLAVGLGAMASPAAAAPFAYVANASDGTVSVVDTATTPPSVAATIPVGTGPTGIAVTPDGKHAFHVRQCGASFALNGIFRERSLRSERPKRTRTRRRGQSIRNDPPAFASNVVTYRGRNRDQLKLLRKKLGNINR